ncbi:GNAT family N-acetyltransferase [Streptomyces sp. NA02950]|uniref:GNAT family N-acetyltransferase n=1 Tax=Streptomyces sp. NA02950 TaxID=2742137 RepID=UPI001591F895|nr:GNAT family N-acetyltransferase [Streptomyces sp. NA02950]QKV95931.1 GNAT family N-acetyltransferase [Streptomyces sp. NA02950]
MTERTIHLVADASSRDTRKFRVRALRWFATVQLDRDNYVDAESSRGSEPTLPADYIEAVNRARYAAIDRIRYDGYQGSFYFGNGPRWIDLCARFRDVEATVEALRAAELEHNYSGLHVLADRLALPVDEWLGPGERELIRGVDFDSPPGVFLKFLRAKATKCGLRLNGRATAGSVWVRPTLSAAQKQIREMFPEQYPGWVDRWTGYVESDDAPFRPWVGGSGEDLSRGAIPVQFQQLETASSHECPCGMRLRDTGDDDNVHRVHHVAWALGVRVSKGLDWWGDLAIVTTQSPISWRKLAHQVARMPQREYNYDFPSWSHLGEPEATTDNYRAYLLKVDECIIGYVAAHDTNEHRRWDLIDGSTCRDADATLRPRIILIWVADSYRHRGIGATLVQALATDFGCKVADVSWSTPVSAAGQRLARRLSPDGIWVS